MQRKVGAKKSELRAARLRQLNDHTKFAKAGCYSGGDALAGTRSRHEAMLNTFSGGPDDADLGLNVRGK